MTPLSLSRPTRNVKLTLLRAVEFDPRPISIDTYQYPGIRQQAIRVHASGRNTHFPEIAERDRTPPFGTPRAFPAASASFGNTMMVSPVSTSKVQMHELVPKVIYNYP